MAKRTEYERGWMDCYRAFGELFKEINGVSKKRTLLKVPQRPQKRTRTGAQAAEKPGNGDATTPIRRRGRPRKTTTDLSLQ